MRFITFALAAFTVLTAGAQTAPDTIARIKGVRELSVTRTPEGIDIVAEGTKDNPDFRYEYSTQYSADSTRHSIPALNLPFLNGFGAKEHKKTTTAGRVYCDFEIYTGTAIPTGSTPAQASFEIGASRIIGGSMWYGSRFCISAAFGMGYAQYAVGDGMRLDAAGQRVYFVPQTPGSRDCSSRLRLFRLHVPLTLTVRPAGNFYITAGAWLNLNCRMWASTAYTIGDTRTSQGFKRLHQRLFTADAFLSLRLSSLGLYARYCPQSLFRKGWGPDFESVSVGMTCNFKVK